MPPKTKLSDGEIHLLEEWVKIGAPDPRDDLSAPVAKATTIDLEAGRKHWAFQPVRDTEPPVVRNHTWPKSDLDRFILAEPEGRTSPAARWPTSAR